MSHKKWPNSQVKLFLMLILAETRDRTHARRLSCPVASLSSPLLTTTSPLILSYPPLLPLSFSLHSTFLQKVHCAVRMFSMPFICILYPIPLPYSSPFSAVENHFRLGCFSWYRSKPQNEHSTSFSKTLII